MNAIATPLSPLSPLNTALQAARRAMTQQDWAAAVRLLQRLPEPLLAASNDAQRLLGEALHRAGRPQEAVNALMQALALRIDDIEAYVQLGFCFQTLQMYREAAECFRTIAALQPDSVMAHAYLVHSSQYAVNWENFDADVAALRAALARKNPQADDEFCVPFTLVGLPHQPQDLLKAARLSVQHLTRGIKPLAEPKWPAHPRLRIGYLSADFHAHATASLLVEVLEARDRQRFEVVLLSHGIDDHSPMRQRLKRACDRFIDLAALDLAGTAKRIREAQIDILIDLKGHTAGSRLSALAWRPAPMQVAWLGFPGSSGADFIDYIIGDPTVTPLDHAPFYSEHIAQLPRCYQPNDSQRIRQTPPTREALGLPPDAFVLLSANSVYKITPALMDAWAEILRRLPKAVIWQLSGGEQADAALAAEALARGIAAQRLIFAPKLPMDQHWQRLAAADLAIDSWPCNGHTTTSDALLAGLPVLTLQGEGFAGRVAASLLRAVDLDELISHDASSYIELICTLAQDGPTLQALRQRLQPPLPLCDAARFARELEALFERMWSRHTAGLPPQALPAA